MRGGPTGWMANSHLILPNNLPTPSQICSHHAPISNPNGQGPEKSCTDWLEGLPLPWHMNTPLAITYLDNLWRVLDSFKVHNILWIHASNCNWLNYGKVTHSRASCYITWQLSNKTIIDLHGYANNLALKHSTPNHPGPWAALAGPTSLLRCSLSLFSWNCLARG